MPLDFPSSPDAQTVLVGDVLDHALRVADAPVARIVRGRRLVGVELANGRAGIASWPAFTREPGAPLETDRDLPDTAHGLARLLADQNTPRAALAMAAVNALAPPPPEAGEQKAQDLIREWGLGKNVTVAGHFPFVERMGEEFASFAVLEMHPRGSDLPLDRAKEVLAKTHVAAFTATTLLNNTLGSMLALVCKGARVVILGPSTPFCSGLFDRGIHALGGCLVEEVDSCFQGIEAGLPFKRLSGVRHLLWTGPEGDR